MILEAVLIENSFQVIPPDFALMKACVTHSKPWGGCQNPSSPTVKLYRAGVKNIDLFWDVCGATEP